MIPLLASFALAADVLDDGRGVRQIVSAVPFSLTTPYTYDWSAEHPLVSAGTILVLQVDPAWVAASDTHQAVLYAGAVPVERLSVSGDRVVVIIPSSVDLATAPLYFGGYELPERVDAKAGAATLAAARGKGIRPLAVPASLTSAKLADHGALATYALGLTTSRAPD